MAAVTECYNDYLDKSQSQGPNLTAITRAGAELVWYEKGAKTIRIDSQTATNLIIASALVETQLPPMPKTESHVICYELPLVPMIPLGGSALTSVLVAPGSECIVIWQGKGDLERGEILTPRELCEWANRQVALPKNPMMKRIPLEVMKKLEDRRMAMMAYHLCRGLGWFSGFISRYSQE